MKKQLFANLFSLDLGMANLTAFDNSRALAEGWEIRDVREDDEEGEGPFSLWSMSPAFKFDRDAAE
ncbi:hypothetical protein [Achromobacter animicus]|uniref:hypothetical protein n=1 Tax=Achromobacter animicus TaxID=1389935 RepID=UPI0028B25B60|nr:hypothetical protein [Achromobacter animicus]